MIVALTEQAASGTPVCMEPNRQFCFPHSPMKIKMFNQSSDVSVLGSFQKDIQ